MRKPIERTKYHCPVCDDGYDTPEEAATCYRGPEWAKPGDIVRRTGDAYSFRITRIDMDGLPGAVGKPPQELIKARNLLPRKDDGGFLAGAWWCRKGLALYPLDEAQQMVKELERRLRYAREFLAQVEATHARHAVATDQQAAG